MKINPICPNCRLENIIFDYDRLPMQCQYCGAELEEEKQMAKNVARYCLCAIGTEKNGRRNKMAKRPERKEHFAVLKDEIDFETGELKEARTPKNWVKYGFNQACDLWEAYEKESEITKDEIVSLLKGDIKIGRGIIETINIPNHTIGAIADSILAVMKQKKGEV